MPDEQTAEQIKAQLQAEQDRARRASQRLVTQALIGSIVGCGLCSAIGNFAVTLWRLWAGG